MKRLTEICLALPEATHVVHGSHIQYLVKKKAFAYFLDNHHGDGIVAVTCKVLSGDNQRLAAQDPKRYYIPAYVGPRGWVALRLDVGKIDWDEVAELVRHGYCLTAPKKLAEQAARA
ncbi:MAG: MmcQ/YjbR family DNA-binding protein [Bryobacteraceae bacterium]